MKDCTSGDEVKVVECEDDVVDDGFSVGLGGTKMEGVDTGVRRLEDPVNGKRSLRMRREEVVRRSRR